MLKDLFISKTRVKLLQNFLSNPGRIFYVREMVRAVGEQINSVRAELARMERVGMVTSEVRANRKFYGFRKDYVYFDELSRLVAKSKLGWEIVVLNFTGPILIFIGVVGQLITSANKVISTMKMSIILGRFIYYRTISSSSPMSKTFGFSKMFLMKGSPLLFRKVNSSSVITV